VPRRILASSRGEAGHARADLPFQLLAERPLGVELARECFVRPFSCAAPPKLIDGGVSKVAMEPWNDRFVRGRLVRSCDDLRKRVLEEVFGERAGT
jgi:hypothetical protein